jgi:hypothetical protein
MDPNKLTPDAASLLLVENFLSQHNKPKSLAPELLKMVGESTTVPARDFMLENGVFKSEHAAYIHANALGVVLDDIRKKAVDQNLTEADCRYVVSPELRADIESEWGVYLAELEGEASYYKCEW